MHLPSRARRAAGPAARAVLAGLGVALLFGAASPMHYDGLLPPDSGPSLVLAALALAVVPGVIEGLAGRAGHRWLGVVTLYALAPVGLWPLGLMSGHWFPDDGITLPSSRFGAAAAVWLLAIAIEWAIASSIAGSAERRRALRRDPAAVAAAYWRHHRRYIGAGGDALRGDDDSWAWELVDDRVREAVETGSVDVLALLDVLLDAPDADPCSLGAGPISDLLAGGGSELAAAVTQRCRRSGSWRAAVACVCAEGGEVPETGSGAPRVRQ